MAGACPEKTVWDHELFRSTLCGLTLRYGILDSYLLDELAELPLAEASEARGMRLSLKPPTQDET